MTDRHDNIAATRPDTTRRKDLESFKALAEIEGKEIISEQKITDDLFLRETRVTYESFDFYFESQDKTYRFNVRAIKDAIVSGKLPFMMYRADLTERWHDITVNQAGIEEERIPLVKNVNRPGIMVLWPDESSVLIDGNHRLVARWRRGLRHFRYAAVAFTDIAPFIKWRKGRSEQV